MCGGGCERHREPCELERIRRLKLGSWERQGEEEDVEKKAQKNEQEEEKAVACEVRKSQS